MRKFFIFFAFLLLGMSQVCVAKSKINPQGRILIEEFKQRKNNSQNLQIPTSNSNNEQVKALVIMAPSHKVSELIDSGYRVVTDLGKIGIVVVNIDRIEGLSQLDCVQSLSFGDQLKPMMNFARPSGKISEVQNGFDHNGSHMSFDGTGVVVGMMDTGLQANHINFKNQDGSSRIQRLFYLPSSDGSFKTYTSETVKEFNTDTDEESHATHVGGILGGGYKGNGTFMSVASPLASTVKEVSDEPIPFYGVATNADLAFSCSPVLSTPNIIQGIYNIVEYAKSVNKPCVVNISLGSTTGPHDGSDAYSQALSALGKEAIICISAGNDGNAPISLTQKFSSTRKELKTTLINANEENNTANGIVDIWCSDNSVLKVTWGIYNTQDMVMTPIMIFDGASQSLSTKNNTDFTTYFNGTITGVSSINPNNNRFNVYNEVNISPKSNVGNRYVVLIVEGERNKTAYVYGSTNALFAKNSLAGYSNGSPKNSINDGACAENVISVGSYNSRITWGQFNNSQYAYSYVGDNALDAISAFSSYGTTFQGKDLPLVAAPGSAIISSISTPYVVKKNNSATMSARVSDNNNTYYWGPMQGTSMSCPFVTGTIGLWLEACSSLDYGKVMDVINSTSVSQTQDAERWGAGKIDALAGVKYILSNPAANGSVWEDDGKRLVVSYNGAGYDVTMGGEARFTVTLYDIQGRPVATARGIDGQASVSTTELTPGVYVLAAQGASARLTRKVTVR